MAPLGKYNFIASHVIVKIALLNSIDFVLWTICRTWVHVRTLFIARQQVFLDVSSIWNQWYCWRNTLQNICEQQSPSLHLPTSIVLLYKMQFRIAESKNITRIRKVLVIHAWRRLSAWNLQKAQPWDSKGIKIVDYSWTGWCGLFSN